MARLTKSQNKVWDRLKNGVPTSSQTIKVANKLPASCDTGSIVVNTTDAKMYIFNGCTWKTIK